MLAITQTYKPVEPHSARDLSARKLFPSSNIVLQHFWSCSFRETVQDLKMTRLACALEDIIVLYSKSGKAGKER